MFSNDRIIKKNTNGIMRSLALLGSRARDLQIT